MRKIEVQPEPETEIAHAPEIELTGATVRYPGRTIPALDGATITIESGSSLSIVGPSGGGKSTLLGLVAGQLPPTDGAVLINEIAAVNISQKATAWVGQRPYLFPATIRENIALGQPDRSDAEVEAAADKARVSEFASHLPDGLDTMLGERGAGISGGEAQRIALARAFLKDAPVVLLDEPTASLDPDTEAEIIATIKQLISGRTAIVATHREQLAEMCNATVRIEAGRVSGVVENVR